MRKLSKALSLIGFILIMVSSWTMYQMPLWGYWPLALFLGMWLVFVFTLPQWFAKDQHKTRWLKLSFFSAILFYIGFPPNVLFFGMALGFVPILLIEREITSIYQRAKPFLFFRYLFISFWLWNILTTWWVSNSMLVGGIVANGLNAILMTIPWLLFHVLTHRSNHFSKFVLLVGLWIGFEYLHHFWEISWPWLTLGNALGKFHILAQWYEYTGYFGGSIWLLSLNILAFKILVGSRKRKRKITWAFFIVLFVPIITSLAIYTNYKERGVLYNALVVQPNYEPHYQKFSIPEETQLQKIKTLIQQSIDPETELIVLPETVFDPVNLNETFAFNNSLLTLFNLIKDRPKSGILLGVGGFHTFEDDPERSTIRQSGDIYYEVYNAALMIHPDSTHVEEYHKSKFVPGAEIFPFKKFLPFIRPLVESLGGTYAGFAPQTEPTNFQLGHATIAPIICYESIYGSWVRQYVQKGANLLAIVTNDGWWDNTPGHIQHLELGKLRAIETRRDIVRSANTGTSCKIDQLGNVSQATNYETDAAFRTTVRLNDQKTFYTKYGDLIVLVSLAMGAISMLYFLILMWRK